MLECIDSYELAEWMAFERAFHPIGPDYRDEALAQIHDQLVLLNKMYGEQFEDNPAEKLDRMIRPHEIMLPPSEGE